MGLRLALTPRCCKPPPMAGVCLQGVAKASVARAGFLLGPSGERTCGRVGAPVFDRCLLCAGGPVVSDCNLGASVWWGLEKTCTVAVSQLFL